MMLALWVLLFFACAFAVLLLPTLWRVEIYNRFRGDRAVTCPTTKRQVAVSFDARHAAVTGAVEKSELRLASCTLWPALRRCDQDCIPEALQAPVSVEGEVGRSKTKRIYHLPVLIATFVAWCVGAVWHSHYLFRKPWMASLGVTRAQLRPLVWTWSPHLLSLAVCILFAYGVAWLLMWSRRKGMWRGIGMSAILWLAVGLAALASTGWGGIPADLLRIEIGYTLLASVMVGAIIGGLTGMMLRRAAAGA
jgi:hypothetical protein